MKKVIFLIISLVFVLMGYSQLSDAEFINLKKEYTLNTDGSIVYNESKQIKLLSHFAFHRLYGETFIVYNTDYQKLNINEAYTVMADGKKIVTPDNAFNEVLPRFAAKAPAFNNLREMVVTHTGLEVGAVINLDYTITSEAGYYDGLFVDEFLEEQSPVTNLEIVINVPTGTVLNYRVFNLMIGEPRVKSGEKFNTYSWKFGKLAAYSKERYQPAGHTDRPMLLASTKDINQAVNSFIGQKAFMEKPDASLQKYVDEIIGDEKNPLKQALLMQKFVVHNIITNNTPLKYTGYKLRTPVEVWNSNYGTVAEKAALLTQMLNLAGIETEASATMPAMFFAKETGSISLMNNFYTVADIQKYGDLFLSVDKIWSQNPEYSMSTDKIIILNPNAKTPKVKTVKGAKNEISLSGSVIIKDTETYDGKLVSMLTGACAPYLNITTSEDYLSGTIRGCDAKVVENTKFKKEVVATEFELTPSGKIQEQDGYYYLPIPYIYIGVDSWHMNILPVERNAPLEIPFVVSESNEFVFVLPDNMMPVNVSADYNIDNAVGSLEVSYKCVGKEISVIRKISFKKQIIPVNEYPDFKKIMDIWNTDKYKGITYKNVEIEMWIQGKGSDNKQ